MPVKAKIVHAQRSAISVRGFDENDSFPFAPMSPWLSHRLEYVQSRSEFSGVAVEIANPSDWFGDRQKC